MHYTVEQNRGHLFNTAEQESLPQLREAAGLPTKGWKHHPNCWTLIRGWHPVLKRDIGSVDGQRDRPSQKGDPQLSVAAAGDGAFFLHAPLQDNGACACVVSDPSFFFFKWSQILSKSVMPLVSLCLNLGVSAGTRPTLERWGATTSTGPSFLTCILLWGRWDARWAPLCRTYKSNHTRICLLLDESISLLLLSRCW